MTDITDFPIATTDAGAFFESESEAKYGAPLSDGKGALKVSGSVIYVDAVADMQALPTASLVDGAIVECRDFGAYNDNSQNAYQYSSSEPKSSHNGDSVISPTVPWDGSDAGLVDFINGVGETDGAGAGCFVSVGNARHHPGRTAGPSSVDDFPSISAGHSRNTIAPDVHSCVISGGGAPNRENVIGGTVANVGTSTTNIPDYPYLGTNSRYCVIGGGYDNVVNGLANVINAGMHCYIENPANHGTISGGSYHAITDGPYNVIAGGTNNKIMASSGYCTISGGSGNEVSLNSQYSHIGGGSNCTVDGTFSMIQGGQSCSIVGDRSIIGGGSSNSINASTGNATLGGGNNNSITGSQGATIAGGMFNVASGDSSSTVLGGRENEAAANYSTAYGYQSSATLAGSEAYASGHFSTPGDAQMVRAIFKGTSTDGNEIILRDVGGTGTAISSKANVALAYKIHVVGHRTDVEGDNALIAFEGLAHRASSGVWTIDESAPAIFGGQTWSARVYSPSAALRIAATGEAGATINWVAKIEYVETSG